MKNLSVGKKIAAFIRNEISDYKILLRNIPALSVSIFILSVVCANLMANKELFSYHYVALDCGFAFSWIMFLCMDVICKRWGAKASIKISFLALFVNLCVCGIFALLSLTSGKWGAFYSCADEGMAATVNMALNSTFCGSWYVVVGSALASMVSSIVNSVLNVALGKLVKKDNFAAFAFRSYISTLISQFVDNLIFALFVSKVFFGWTWIQVFLCSIIAAIFELLAEVLFSHLGWKILKSWEKDGVGKEYLEMQNRAKVEES